MTEIKLLVTDVDGTLTDGKIYMGAAGEVFKAFNIKDGYGIKNILNQYGIACAVITGRKSEIVQRRCEELDIKYLFQNVSDKVNCLRTLVQDLGFAYDNVAYIGDDLNDLEVMNLCGLKGCPSDAIEEVKAVCDFISPHKGGDGAVRDFIDYIVKQQ